MKTIRTTTLELCCFVDLDFLFTFITSTKAAAQTKPTGNLLLLDAVPQKFLFGEATIRSATLAIDEINAAGGVNIKGEKHPFKLEVGDTRDTAQGVPTSEALLVIEKLILDRGAKFFVGGPIRSEAALASMDLFAKHKAVVIWGAGTWSPLLHKRIAENYDRYKYLFRQTSEIGWMIQEMNALFKELKDKHGLTKAHIIVQDVEHARKAGDAIAGVIEKGGWTITGKDRFPQGTTDFSAPLLSAKNAGAEAFFMWTEAPEGQILIKQWYALKIPALPIGFVNYIEPVEAWEQTGKACEYAILTQGNAGAAYTKFNPWVVKWLEAYKKRWGTEPEMYCVQVPYTSVYVLKDALERAGSMDPDEVVKALEKTDMKDTPQGRIRFDPKSHQVIPSLDPKEGAVGGVFQANGKRVVVFRLNSYKVQLFLAKKIGLKITEHGAGGTCPIRFTGILKTFLQVLIYGHQ
jgi:branched-chain amino acid transport system substrate-binding protein